MDKRWIALVHLPSENERLLAETAASLGVLVHRINPKDRDRLRPPGLPALRIASVDGYRRVILPRLPKETSGGAPIPTVLLSADALTPQTLRFRLRHGLWNAIPESLWNHPCCLKRTIRGLLFPETMFDAAAFVPDASVSNRFMICTMADKSHASQEAEAFGISWGATQRQARVLHLMADELLGNALFHSFRAPDSTPKYSPRHLQRLDEGDSVVLEMAASDGNLSVTIEDNSGTITPRDVLGALLRQSSRKGIRDSRGRGFHLIHHLCDHLSLSLEPGRRTRVTALVHISPHPSARTLLFFVPT